MGNCFAKRHDLVNNCPVIFPEDSRSNFEPLQTDGNHISSSLDFNGRNCSSDKDLSALWPCSVKYSKMGYDSAVKKTAIPEQVSVGGSVNQRSCKLAQLLEKSFVDNDDDDPPMEVIEKTAIPEQERGGGSVNQRSWKLAQLLEKSFVDNDNDNDNDDPPMELLNPILLSPLRKSSGKSTSMGSVHEFIEDPVHLKTESPSSKFVGVKSLSSVRSDSVRSRCSSEVDTISSAIILDTLAGDDISGIRTPMESPNLSSILSLINIEKNNYSERVDEADATAAKFNRVGSCEIKDCQSRSSGPCRPYSLALEGEKAFGSPFLVDSNNLCEKTRKCSSFDEFSDSSSDLFDIDFQKPERVAGVAF